MATVALLMVALAHAERITITPRGGGGGGGGGGGSCNGTIDLSAGCAQPMLGGL